MCHDATFVYRLAAACMRERSFMLGRFIFVYIYDQHLIRTRACH